MTKITLLTDYRGAFESKFTAFPYRSGMDKQLLMEYFNEFGHSLDIIGFSEINFRIGNYKDQVFLYTSSEDIGYFYKSFIEDIILGLTLKGAYVLPEFKFLRSNNNKVFMEILRDIIPCEEVKNISSFHFGAIEEMEKQLEARSFPYVIKPAEGAMSEGVGLAKSNNELFKQAKSISKTQNLIQVIWELARAHKHKNYIKESKFRKKFIIQNFIPNLSNDWKILIFGKKYFILHRQNRKNDFRASGGGRLSFEEIIPEGILDFAKIIFRKLNVPNLSIDVAFDGKEFFLLEFQALFFGSYTLEYSPFYFINENNKWYLRKEKSILEKVYAESISFYLSEFYNNDFTNNKKIL